MIELIVITDFQKHKKLKIKFHPNVTTIIGRNDAGKSAVIRAFRFLGLNHPKGTSFIRRGAKECVINLLVDGRKIRRTRSKKTNTYYLDGRKFAAFGLGKVPDSVSELLNIGEVNFQSQLAPPFWFLETAGQVSKNLNAIINLSSIDKTLENAAKKLRKSQASVTISQERLNEAKAALKEIEWVKECDMDLNDVLMAKKRHLTISNKRSRLEEMIGRIQSLTKRRKTLQRAAKEGRDVVKMGDQGAKRQEQARTLERLIERVKASIKLSSIAVPDINDLLSAKIECDKSAEDRRELEYMVNQLKESIQWRETKRQELEKSKKSLTKLIGKRCPTCGQKI